MSDVTAVCGMKHDRTANKPNKYNDIKDWRERCDAPIGSRAKALNLRRFLLFMAALHAKKRESCNARTVVRLSASPSAGVRGAVVRVATAVLIPSRSG